MSIDKTLRMKASLIRSRNVLTRHERIQELERLGKFKEQESSPFGLPKVRVLKVKKRVKKKEKAAAAPGEGAAAAAPAAAAAAPAASAAKPAAKAAAKPAGKAPAK